MNRLLEKIHAVSDFPEPGVVFRDITPLLRDPASMRIAVQALIEPFIDAEVTAVAGMEARGFIFAPLVAWGLQVGFVPLRKPGKLPLATERVEYELEYGTAALEVHADALDADDRVLLVDDLIATGGTAAAGRELVQKLGARVVGYAFLIELDALAGRNLLAGAPIHSLLHY